MTDPTAGLQAVAVPEQLAATLNVADDEPVLTTVKLYELVDDATAVVEPASGVTDTDTGGATVTLIQPVVVADSPLAASETLPVPLPLPVAYVTVTFADCPARMVTKLVTEHEATGLTFEHARSYVMLVPDTFWMVKTCVRPLWFGDAFTFVPHGVTFASEVEHAAAEVSSMGVAETDAPRNPRAEPTRAIVAIAESVSA